MGHSRAHAVFTTIDADEAYARAWRLVGLLERVDEEVYVDAEVRTVEEARRVGRLLPGAAVDHVGAVQDPATGEYLFCELDLGTAGDAEVRAELPLFLSAEVPAATVGPDFVRALGEGVADIWWRGRWPDDPETDRLGSDTYDGVQLVLHGDRAQIDGWTPHHTVFVHVDRPGDLPRARKLAARIDGELIGGVQIGW
ncbi:hypothetical protein [Streptomyces sp. NRRL B-24572]|uniref:hypothetical protein n=1 Tax=Streptomyces sp. NRRL B-24572 TaxID=1962156 RepID=UPI000A3C726B|nr:hypothetical protein [Streptomyces sp. NRRL B-24572]